MAHPSAHPQAQAQALSPPQLEGEKTVQDAARFLFSPIQHLPWSDVLPHSASASPKSAGVCTAARAPLGASAAHAALALSKLKLRAWRE